MKVEELMVKDVVTTDPDNDLAAVADLMLEHAVGCVVVVGESGVVGVITDRDMLECLRAAHDAGMCVVARHMNSPVVTIEPQADLVEAARMMVAHGIKRLPVVGAGALAGILSFADIAGFLKDNLGTLAPDLESLTVLVEAGMLHRRE